MMLRAYISLYSVTTFKRFNFHFATENVQWQQGSPIEKATSMVSSEMWLIQEQATLKCRYKQILHEQRLADVAKKLRLEDARVQSMFGNPSRSIIVRGRTTYTDIRGGGYHCGSKQ